MRYTLCLRSFVFVTVVLLHQSLRANNMDQGRRQRQENEIDFAFESVFIDVEFEKFICLISGGRGGR
jgi:hypothetical protein